jgi:hypothetical protein
MVDIVFLSVIQYRRLQAIEVHVTV